MKKYTPLLSNTNLYSPFIPFSPSQNQNQTQTKEQRQQQYIDKIELHSKTYHLRKLNNPKSDNDTYWYYYDDTTKQMFRVQTDLVPSSSEPLTPYFHPVQDKEVAHFNGIDVLKGRHPSMIRTPLNHGNHYMFTTYS